jgi:hypothetical protein
MRTTRASNAVLRLKQRDPSNQYSMLTMSDGRLCLTVTNENHISSKLNEPLELDAFVAFVNGIKSQAPRKQSKLDIAFEKQLKK